MRRGRVGSLALGLVLVLLGGATAASAAGSGGATSLRAEARRLRAEGRYEQALTRLEEAVFDSLAADDAPGAALALSEMGRTYEKAGRNDEALQYYRSALATHIQLAARPEIARDLADLGRVYALMGDGTRARDHFDKAGRMLAGVLTPQAVVTAADPLGCGSTKDVTPNPADFTGGTWTGFGSGTSEKEALQSVLNAAFGTVYQPTCKTTCPDGSAPPTGQCKANVVSTAPSSTTPADYGSPAWKVREVKLKNGTTRTVIGPVKITKFPADIKATQSCSACTKCAVDADLNGN